MVPVARGSKTGKPRQHIRVRRMQPAAADIDGTVFANDRMGPPPDPVPEVITNMLPVFASTDTPAEAFAFVVPVGIATS